jgi:hypothetical protein
LKIGWIDENGEQINKRFFTKIQAVAELGISYTSICRKLKGMNVPKFAHLNIEAIREPAWTPSVQLLC